MQRMSNRTQTDKQIAIHLHLGDVGVEGRDATAAQSLVGVAVSQRVAYGLAHLLFGQLLLLRKGHQLLV